jgi:IS30 family transposase
METFTQLSYHERIKIYRGLCDGKSQGKIARILERSPSTVSREIHRNSDQYGYLYPGDAHKKAQERKHKNEAKINKNKDLRDYIIMKLGEKWSPIAIAGGWNLENDETITKEAIYQWIYAEEGEALGLKKLLVRARKKRGLRRKLKGPKIKNRVSVHVRPESINQRSELGHYECDLIFNSGSQSKNICTIVERVTREAILIKNEDKTTKTVMGSLIDHIKKTGIKMKSITFDNGSEFADHDRLKELGIDTYFCDPGSPWQKGSIENFNGVARRFLPFSLSASEITHEYVATVNNKLNNMPRAILSFKTPLEAAREAANAS